MKIKLSELRQIVKSILRENPDPNLAAELAKMKNVPVRWYSDEENTKGYNVMTIKNIIPGSNSTSIEGVFEDSTTISKVFLICQNNFVILRSADSANTKLYNKKYVEKLKALLCTKSAGGVEVTNIGDYSSTTSKAPVNVAESKLRKIVKSIIRENPDPTPNPMAVLKRKAASLFDKAEFAAKVKPLIGQKVRLYNDEANTDEIGVNKITNIENESDDHITITLDGGTNHFCIWACGMKFLSYTYGTESAQFANNKVYNKSLIAQLDKILCTTNSGGKRVMNIGSLSQTNQNTPVNVAESKLRKIVKSIIRENPDPTPNPMAVLKGKAGSLFDKAEFAAKVKPLIGQKVRFYADEANTKYLGGGGYETIENIVNYMGDIKITVKDRPDHMYYTWSCDMDFIEHSIGHQVSKVYNKAFITELKKILCTTSSGGKPVMNIGKFSQTNQNTPMNVAESKLRKIVKSIIKERDCGCSK
jgi:Icc-related predicted phosphoesterase